MLKIEYSKYPRYTLAIKDKNYYLIDVDSDIYSKYIVFPKKMNQKVYQIDESTFNKLKKDVLTMGDLKGSNVGGIMAISAMTLPIATILSKTLNLVQKTLNIVKFDSIITFFITVALAMMSYKILDFLYDKNYRDLLYPKKEVGKLKIDKLNKVNLSKIRKNNLALMVMIVGMLGLGLFYSNNFYMSIILIFLGYILFIFQHRVFFVRAKVFGVDFKIELNQEIKLK